MCRNMPMRVTLAAGLAAVMLAGGDPAAGGRGGSTGAGTTSGHTGRSDYSGAAGGRWSNYPGTASGRWSDSSPRWSPSRSGTDRSVPYVTGRESSAGTVAPPSRPMPREDVRRTPDSGAGRREEVRVTTLADRPPRPDVPPTYPTGASRRQDVRTMGIGPTSPQSPSYGPSRGGSPDRNVVVRSTGVPFGRLGVNVQRPAVTTWRTDGAATGTTHRTDGNYRPPRVRPGGYFHDRRPIDRLPHRCVTVNWGGYWYYYFGYDWWRPYWYWGVVSYWPVYPQVGHYYAYLPEGYWTTAIGGTTYYVYDSVYYTTASDRGGYVVAEPPAEPPVVDASEEAAPAPAPAPPDQAARTAPPAAQTPETDPFEVLKRMADYTGSLPRMSLLVSDSFEEVRGPAKAERNGRFSLFLERPDRLTVEYRGDMYDRDTVYDGRTVTILDARKNIYSRTDVPGTIAGMLDVLARTYGVSMPLADLVASDYRVLARPVLTGQYVGLEQVGPKAYHHLAFAEDAADWEVWVEAGGVPIPRRYVITYKDLPGAPRYVATVLSWDTSPISEARFTPSLPSGAQQVELAPAPR